jgi:aerobic-type carbon monoxide dehydrogenase small subunit (CoxS/CutS family)
MSLHTLKVNGRSHEVDVDPATPLLYVLSDDLDLRGPKFGCGLGQCGACTVVINGQATRSCITPVSAVGQREITTLEGLGTPESPHPIQQAFITEQKFRQDLYFRIGEVTINVPPLRERAGGATVLAHAMLRKFGNVGGKSKRGFTEEATAALEAYSWPGNVRELENRVKTAMIMAETNLISANDLGLKESTESALLFNLKEVRTRAERQAIRQAMSITDGNVSRAAELLGVTRPTLYDLMEKYGIRETS